MSQAALHAMPAVRTWHHTQRDCSADIRIDARLQQVQLGRSIATSTFYVREVVQSCKYTCNHQAFCLSAGEQAGGVMMHLCEGTNMLPIACRFKQAATLGR